VRINVREELDPLSFYEDTTKMTARTLLIEEIARTPESVAREMLAHLRCLLPEKTPQLPVNDHFDSYWSKLYGCMEGETWNEPVDLPFEKREDW
jgi:hypothetical protein